MTVSINPVRASHRRVGAPEWNGGPRSDLPDALAQAVTGQAAVADNPAGHIRQAVEQVPCHGQFVPLSRREREGNGPAASVRDDTGLGAQAAARAAKHFTMIPLSA